jgi:lambda repressor-like predicted transcriptional regulator
LHTTSTEAIISYLSRYGESVTTRVRPKGVTASNVEAQLRKMTSRGDLIRRQVILQDNSNKKIWAYRLPHQKEKIKSFASVPRDPISHRRITDKYPKPKPINNEPEWVYWLRNMPRRAA